MKSYNPTPRVKAKYGAPMGRVNRYHPADEALLHLRRVYLNSGGYDNGGAYWGHGKPLYAAYDKRGETCVFVYATSRDGAKDKVLKMMPDATFYR